MQIFTYQRTVHRRSVSWGAVSQLSVELGMHVLNPSDAEMKKPVRRIIIHRGWSRSTKVSPVGCLVRWGGLKKRQTMQLIFFYPNPCHSTTISPFSFWLRPSFIRPPFRPSVCHNRVPPTTRSSSKRRPPSDGEQSEKVYVRPHI